MLRPYKRQAATNERANNRQSTGNNLNKQKPLQKLTQRPNHRHDHFNGKKSQQIFQKQYLQSNTANKTLLSMKYLDKFNK